MTGVYHASHVQEMFVPKRYNLQSEMFIKRPNGLLVLLTDLKHLRAVYFILQTSVTWN